MARQLASIQKIVDIQPIEGADAIEVATVLAWKVVVKKGEFKVGDLVIYCEIDSWIPTELAPFLSKGQDPREYNGVKGEKLRTIKLRGTTSQGLILPISSLGEIKEIEGKVCFRINTSYNTNARASDDTNIPNSEQNNR